MAIPITQLTNHRKIANGLTFSLHKPSTLFNDQSQADWRNPGLEEHALVNELNQQWLKLFGTGQA
jgi:hypothetical protein